MAPRHASDSARRRGSDRDPLMGAPKKIDVFNREVKAGTGTSLSAEDAASRARIERYQAMADGPAKTAALEGEHGWREELGLTPL